MVGVIASRTASGAAETVRAGEDLQAALDRAQPGDEIRLEPGATFTGNFVLRAKSGGDGAITLRTDAPDNRLPSDSERIGPQHAAFLPTIAQGGNGPALRTEPGARHWRLIGLRITGSGSGDIVALGDTGNRQASYTEIPEDLVLDRLLILGDPGRGQKRGVALNSASTIIRNSHIAGIKEIGQETQAIAGWNGPGPYLLENNYLEAAGISVLFGGAEPAIGGLVPSDITVRRNLMAKPLEWRDERWTVKNLFELKNARRVQVDGNVFEYNWSAAQVGFAILFTVRSSGARANWTTVEDVRFENNIVRHVAGGINILGFDSQARSQQTRNIVIRNNLFYDVNNETWGGNGMFLQVGDEPADIRVEHNTIVQSGNLVTAYGGTRASRRAVHDFRFRDNIGWHNAYGLFGSGVGTGQPALDAYFPGGEFTGNVIAGGSENRYPAGNRFASPDDVMAQFVQPGSGNFRLRPSSWIRTASSDGSAAGADLDEIYRAIGWDPR
jgi:hypothetical protein